MLEKKRLYVLIAIAAASSLSVLFSSILPSADACLYAYLSKLLAHSSNWAYIYYDGVDWLDKPHFPFWIMALSFSVFGTGAFAYFLPGLIFNFVGAYYTYELARKLFGINAGLLAALFYLTALHLMFSIYDLRAEAYLLGASMPAVYYMICYDEAFSYKSLFFGTLCTGIAMMIKGPFIMATIFSGVLLRNFGKTTALKIVSPKWLLAYFLSAVFTFPELIALYIQFDAHPGKMDFYHTGMSGISWFVWGSQFGRFFGFGPISKSNGDVLFFVHTFMWSFLPWILIYVFAVYRFVSGYKNILPKQRSQEAMMLWYFVPTFMLFSLSRFQLDHYINTILPFAAIGCAAYLIRESMGSDGDTLAYFGNLNLRAGVQKWLSIIILFASALIVAWCGTSAGYKLLGVIPLAIGGLGSMCARRAFTKLFALPTVAMAILFIIWVSMFSTVGGKYYSAYNISRDLARQQMLPIYSGPGGDFESLSFYSDFPVINDERLTKVSSAQDCYAVVGAEGLAELKNKVALASVKKYEDVSRDALFKTMISTDKISNDMREVYLVKIDAVSKQ